MPLIIRFTRYNCLTNCSYPEGNFGVNQLLDGSMSLSLLYSHQTIDLHVRIAISLHQDFSWLRHVQAKITTSFGSHHVCFCSIHQKMNRPIVHLIIPIIQSASQDSYQKIYFHYAPYFFLGLKP